MKKSLVINQAETLGDWAYIGVKKHFQKILKHESVVFKNPNPEAVHQMRVGTRRLRSAITGFAVAIDLPKEASENKLAKIARILGELRDLDVLKETLEKTYQPELPKTEQKLLEKVLEDLAKQHKQVVGKVQSTFDSDRYQDLKQAWQKWLKHPKYTELAQAKIRDVLPDLLLPSLSKLLLHPAWLVGDTQMPTAYLCANKVEISSILNPQKVEEILAAQGNIVHSLRKQIKQVRYQMELFTNFYGSIYGDYLQDFKDIQEILGKIQDSVVLTEFIEDVSGSEIKDKLPTLANILAKTRYEAWVEWQPLQQKYLHPRRRQAARIAMLEPIAELADNSIT